MEKDIINFANGQPSEDILPTQLFANAAQKAFTNPNAAHDVLQYGHEYGNPEFLTNLSKFLSEQYGSPVPRSHLCATPGASLGLQHILTLLTTPQTRIYIHDPTYFLVFDIFRDLGHDRPIPISDLPQLQLELARHPIPHDGYGSLLYCVPTHRNPTGDIMGDRQAWVALAKRHRMLIVCDDVYDLLSFDGSVPTRLAAYDQVGLPVVISNGSFSKVLAPGARAGWIEARPDLIQVLGQSGSFVSGGSPSLLACQIINEMLKDGSLAENIEFLKKTHSERLERGLWEPIQKHLVPLGCSVKIKPRGGYFVWLRLPIPGEALVKVINEHQIKVNIGRGDLFFVSRNPDNDFYCRLSFAHYNVRDLQLGIDRLKQALLIALKNK